MSSKQNFEYLRTSDGSLTLFDPVLCESYHSKFGALTESQCVFLENSGAEERLRQQRPTRIFEVGFGTGMNFLLTAQVARHFGCTLSYTSVENCLLPVDVISTVLRDTFRDNIECVAATETAIRQLQTTSRLKQSFQIDRFTKLTLLLLDARQTEVAEQSFDAIYLDAFSSKNNPQLWTPGFLKKMFSLLADDGVLATYSVNRAFRDALTASGFRWQKHSGPSGKREVLTAQRADSS